MWKTLTAVMLGIFSFLGGAVTVFTFNEKVRIEPLKQQLELQKDRATELERINTEVSNENIRLRAELDSLEQGSQNQDNQLSLALFSGYESSYNFDLYTGNVAVGLILSEQTRNSIAQTPPKRVEAVVIFAANQDSIILWIRDGQGNAESRVLFRHQGTALNPEREDERHFELLISNFQSINPSSISKLIFETRNIPKTAQRFLVKSVDFK